MIAAIVLGEGVLPPPATFAPGIVRVHGHLPLVRQGPDWISIFAHIVFGLTAAGVYVTIKKHHLHEAAPAGAPLREKKA